MAWVELLDHVFDLGQLHGFSLSTEHLLQILCSDEATVIDIEVMESEFQIRNLHHFLLVHTGSDEFPIPYVAVVADVDPLENLMNIFFWEARAFEGLFDFVQEQSARVLRIERSESVTETFEVEGRRLTGTFFLVEGLGDEF